jgi:hypothetical protein
LEAFLFARKPKFLSHSADTVTAGASSSQWLLIDDKATIKIHLPYENSTYKPMEEDKHPA